MAKRKPPTEDLLLERLNFRQTKDGWWSPQRNLSTLESPASKRNQTVATTAFALLAFSGSGHTLNRGQYRTTLRDGVGWLRAQQDLSTGLFTDTEGDDALFAHAVATLALAESYYFSKSPLLKRNLRKATNAIFDLQRPYSAWPAFDDEDSSLDVVTTSWMLHALLVASDCKIQVPSTAIDSGMDWLLSQNSADARCRWIFLELMRPKPDGWKHDQAHPLSPLIGVFVEQQRRDPPYLLNQSDHQKLEAGYFFAHAVHQWGSPRWINGHSGLIKRFHSTYRHGLVRPVSNRTAALQALILQSRYRYARTYPAQQ